jgi:acetyl-CoA carboxylase biotin carboxyl carrier protein
MGSISQKDIETLIEMFERSDWEELHLEVDGHVIDLLRREGEPIKRVVRNTGDGPPTMRAPNRAAAPDGASPPAAAQSPVMKSKARTAPPDIPTGWLAIRAPNLGTFFRAAKPGAPPYVDVGQEIREDTEVCLIEVMKLFTSVSAGVRGILRKVYVEDGEVVEHDQPLFLVEPKN